MIFEKAGLLNRHPVRKVRTGLGFIIISETSVTFIRTKVFVMLLSSRYQRPHLTKLQAMNVIKMSFTFSDISVDTEDGAVIFRLREGLA